MKLLYWLKRLVSPDMNRENVQLPQSLKEFEKQYIKRTQEELSKTLQILEIELDAVSRK